MAQLAALFLLNVAMVTAIGEANGQGKVASDPEAADVVIYGGTSAGVAAAVQVSRMGHSVLLIEPGSHIGGLTAGGLGFTDSGDKRVIGGIAREYYQRIHKHYENPDAWVYEKPSDNDRFRSNDDAMWTFEPKVAEALFHELLSEARVRLILHERLNRTSGVQRDGSRITSITTESGRTFRGKQFIDATYEGDLMAAAEVRYTVGREANSKYGETLNGNQVKSNSHSHRFLKDIDPYVKPGDPASGLLDGIESDGAGDDGRGDHRVQAYCFRMCMSNVAVNRVPFPKPQNYNESRYELLFRNFEAGDLRFPMKPDMMPNGKTDTNNNCAFSTDYLGGNYAYPDADYAEREAIIRDHEDYQKGLMWSLANHPRVPESIQTEMSKWGLPKDEFVDNGNWPHQLYIREARRMVSDYVVSELDCRRVRIAEDSVGLGSYNMDSHNVRRFVTADGFVQNEGDVQVSPGGPYLISYRAIIPASDQTANLSVPVCLSSTHIAYGSIRMEPVFMVLGQSAATAVVLAMEADVDLQSLPFAALRKRLLMDGQVLDLPPDAKKKMLTSKASLDGVVQDDTDAELTGAWIHSSSTGSYVGNDYIHDGDMEKGLKSVKWILRAPAGGQFELRFSYSQNPNRATNVPVQISSGGTTRTVTVDQQQAPKIDNLFHSLGAMKLNLNDTVEVMVSNEG
ncbi:MAG: FAD-dependent oxidoreductase, partial [Planctomycetota bacterium]|nr:FAD-dependent oxidoreductase [Planctomycetota bacterium]